MQEQESIRVLVAADTIEDTRRLGEIFAHNAGFVIAGSASTTGLDGLKRTAADVLVICSKELPTPLTRAGTPVLWIGPAAGLGGEDSGIASVLSPDASPAQIRAAAAARAVGLGVRYHTARSRSEEAEFSLLEPLTERELEVLNLVAEGFSNPQIATRLRVSRNTVKFHVSSIIAKLGANSRTEAVTVALRRGLIII